MKKILLALLALFLADGPAAAADPTLPQPGDRLVSSGQLPLRAASPDASFGTPGEKIGWVKQGDRMKVLRLKQVSTVFGFEVWIEVKTESGAQGWLRDGLTAEVLHGQASLAPLAWDGVLAQAE
jgi:hypothetical protein